MRDLPDEHPARRYGEEQIEILSRLGYSSSIAAEGPIEPATGIGWELITSHGPARAEAR